MPSMTRPTLWLDLTPITSNSWANWGPSCSDAPLHTARIVLPPDRMSKLAHWIARRIGSLRGKLAKQMVPNVTVEVWAARADKVTMDSNLGFDSKLSPTHTPWK